MPDVKRLRLAELAAYAGLALTLLPSVWLAPISLDDFAELQELLQSPFVHVLDVDRFGHLRPIKSVLFWVLSRHLEWLVLWRCVALLLVLISARVWQQLCAALLKSEAWALGVAMCWALNPITASCLCWLSTSNLIIAVLGSLTYVWLLDRSRASWQVVAAHFSLIVALLSHELALFAPVLFVFYRRSRLAGEWSPAERRRTFLIALASVACSAVLGLGMYALSAARNIDYRVASYPRALLTLNAPRYLSENLRLWFWLPGRFGVLLAAAPSQQIWVGALGWLLLAVLCVVLWRLCRRDGVLLFGLLACAITLLPFTNIVPLGITPVALHYLYLPGLALALLLVRIAQRLSARFPVLPTAVLALLVVAWLPEQHRVFAAWSDATKLFSATIQNYPDNIEARVNLSAIYLDTKRFAEADVLLRESLERAPDNLGLIFNRFKLLTDTGKVDEALAFFDAHPQLDTPSTWLVRGLFLLRMQRDALASDAFSRALELAVLPDERLAAGRGLVITLVRMGDDARAQRVADSLIAEFPERAELRFLVPRR